MITTHSNDPDVAAAAETAAGMVREVLAGLPPADTFDYGGHELHVGEYGVCSRCTRPIAEAQHASQALLEKAAEITNPTIAEHLQLAAELLKLEARAAQIRAEFHNGKHSEPILNDILGFIYDRRIHDSYDHSHHGNEREHP